MFAKYRMSFSKSACIVRKLYCGNGNIPKDTSTKKYSGKGLPYQCLKKGYGIADWEHKKNQLSKHSLQQIMYIGPIYEANFKKLKIYSILSLLKKTKALDKQAKKDLIAAGCKRKDGKVDQKAFNSIVLFLYEQGQRQLPSCRIVRE